MAEPVRGTQHYAIPVEWTIYTLLIHSKYQIKKRVKSEDEKYWQMNFADDLFCIYYYYFGKLLFQHNVINNQLK